MIQLRYISCFCIRIYILSLYILIYFKDEIFAKLDFVNTEAYCAHAQAHSKKREIDMFNQQLRRLQFPVCNSVSQIHVDQ